MNPNSFMLSSLLLLVSCGSSDSTPDKSISPQIRLQTHVSAGGSITPTEANVGLQAKVEFTLTPEVGYELGNVTGCEGNLHGTSYVIDNAIKDCTINAEFNKQTFTLNVQMNEGGTVDRLTQTVNYGERASVEIKQHVDHKIGTVTGCQGSLSSTNVFTTAEITGDCDIQLEFVPLHPAPANGLERIRLPLVVHVLENEHFHISNEQILSQLVATNMHFRGLNSQELQSLPVQDRPFIADVGLQFYLADKDPNGLAHSGINRVYAQKSGFELDYGFAYADMGGIDTWPSDKYVNVWIGVFRDSFSGDLVLTGRTHIPGDNPVQGISVEQGVFGTILPREEGLDLGKTLTHELGHYLGLIGHTHGTPTDRDTHSHLSCDGLNSQCKNSDLLYNYMNVQQNDSGMRMFSLSQRNVMRAWLMSGPLQGLYLNNRQSD